MAGVSVISLTPDVIISGDGALLLYFAAAMIRGKHGWEQLIVAPVNMVDADAHGECGHN